MHAPSSTSATTAPRGHLPTLISSFLYFDTSFMVWVLLGALGNYIGEDLGLSIAQRSVLTAVPVLSGAALRIGASLLAEYIGTKRTALLGMALTVGTLLLAFLIADSMGLLLLIGVLLGVAGASFAVAVPMGARWYPPERRGLAAGIAGAGNSGTVLTALFAPRLAEALGWQAVFAIMIGPVLVSFLVMAAFAQEPPVPAGQPRGLQAHRAVLKTSDTWWFCLLYAVTFGGFVGLGAYLAIFFRDQYDVSKVQAGNLTALCVFAGSLVRPIGGYLADRLGGTRVLTFAFFLIAITMVGASTLPGLSTGVALLTVGMGAFGLGNGAVFQLIAIRFGARMGAVTGMVGAAGGVGGFMLPLLLGLLRGSTGSYGISFALLAAVGGVALLVLLALLQGWRLTWLATQKTARVTQETG